MNRLKAIGERYRVSADPVRTERRIELVMVLLAVLLLLQLAYGVSRLAITATPVAVAPTVDSLQVMHAFLQDTVTAEQNAEISNRPLLWPSRQSVVSAAAETAQSHNEKQQELDDIKLLGVFGAGDTIGIIVRVKDRAQRVRLGEKVGGWTLESVDKTGAVFTVGSRQKTLVLLPGQIRKPDKVKKRG